MTTSTLKENVDSPVQKRAKILYSEHRQRIFKHTDHVFVGLMIFQWIAGIIIALVVSPKTWIGVASETHIHVWAAIFLGGGIAAAPIALGIFMPGEKITRYCIGISQMLFSALLIHLTGGRIETHFHVFGSLAFLAFYRDWKVLIPATIIVAVDHMLRGIFWPQSVFGVLTASSWRWVEHTAWVIFEDIFLVASCKRSLKEMWDIAERTAQLEANNLLIKEKVEERTKELHKSKENVALLKDLSSQLEQSNKDLEQFAYAAAHDLKSPLKILKSYVELLQKKYENPQAGTLIKTIIDSANNLDDLTTALLEYAKVQKDKNEFQLIDCEKVLEMALTNLAMDIKESGARVKHSQLGSILGDKTLLAQLFQNLISNAIKYKSEASPQIEISRSSDKNVPVFAVKDNGVGIKGQDGNIFEIFRRGHTNVEGAGIGLATCKKIVEIHGGKIWVESQPGKGSIFYFTLGQNGLN